MDIATLSLSIGSYVIIAIGGLIKVYMNKKKADSVYALIIPPGSNRSQMLKKFREDSRYDNVFFWYIEDTVRNNSTYTPEVKIQMNHLKKVDPITYNSKMMTHIKSEYETGIDKLKLNSRTTVMVLSNPEYAAYLKIKRTYSFLPDNKLHRKILAKREEETMLITYIRTLINPKTAEIYGDEDDLFDLVNSKITDIQKKKKLK